MLIKSKLSCCIDVLGTRFIKAWLTRMLRSIPLSSVCSSWLRWWVELSFGKRCILLFSRAYGLQKILEPLSIPYIMGSDLVPCLNRESRVFRRVSVLVRPAFHKPHGQNRSCTCIRYSMNLIFVCLINVYLNSKVFERLTCLGLGNLGQVRFHTGRVQPAGYALFCLMTKH